MDWFCLVLAVFAYLSLQTEAKPLLLDADYTDDDLVAEETRAFAHASVDGGAFASAGSFSFGGFGNPLAFAQPFYNYNRPGLFGSLFPHPYYGQPPFPAHQGPMRPQHFPAQPQQPMRDQNGRGNHNNPYRQMQSERPFGNNNTRPKEPPQENTQIETIAPVPDVSPIPPKVIPPKEIPPKVIPTAKPISLPASSVEPVTTESTSTTTEEPFYDIDVRIAE